MNELNVFSVGWVKALSFTAAKHNIRNLFKNIHCCYERITKGFCSRDIWNMDDYVIRLLRDMFKYFADNCQGYPGDGSAEGESMEAWEKYLNNISYLLNQSLESVNIDSNVRKSAREEAFKYILKRFDNFWD